MTEQIRNDDMVELLRADFFSRTEPNASWSHSVSNHLLLPALRAFWPCSACSNDHVNTFLTDIACGFNLTFNNTPLLRLTTLGLIPMVQFVAASSQYLQHADDPQFDILGTETHVVSTQRGLTLGSWCYWTDRTGQQAIISKWTTAGNMRSYRVYKNAAHNIVFEISNGGAAVDATVTSAGTVAEDTWYHIVARFVPGSSMDIYIDAVRTSAATAVASIFHSNAVFNVARSNATDYASMITSLMWLSASCCWSNTAATRDLIPWGLYEHSRRMFNR